MTSGTSLERTESRVSVPTPLMPNTVSVMTEPPSAHPKFTPIVVTTGSSAFLIACFQMILFSFTPFALAVLM